MGTNLTDASELVAAAHLAQAQAYAPYSQYHVGAAVLGINGKIYSGCNIENVSYGLAICAERNAVFQMVADGCRELTAVAVVTRNGGSPCGACRQVLNEFAANIPVYMADEMGNTRHTTLHKLLPDSFDPAHLS